MDTNNLTLIDLCKRLAKTKPKAEAFLFFDKHGIREICTPHDLYVTACRFASLLRQWGFEHGDVVANALPNSTERLVTDFGVMFAGCVPMNCQTHEKDGADFWNNAKISQCKGVIFSCHAQDPVDHLLAPFLQPETDTSPGIAVDISTPQAPDLKKAIVCRRKSWSERENIQPLLEILRDPSEFPDEDVDQMPVFEAKPSDTAYVLLTSGSTGYCKMVPRTHQELVSTIFAIEKLDRGKMFNDRPLGWAGGFPYDFYDECIPRVLHDRLSDAFVDNAKDLWSVMEKLGCTKAFLLPQDIRDFQEAFKDELPSFKLSCIFVGGQSVKKSTAEAVGALCHVMVICYVSSETGLVSVAVVKDAASFENFLCGFPSPGVQLRIVDKDLNDLPTGQEGDLLVKSPRVFKQYFKQQPKHPIFTEDGWYITHDRALLDESGKLYVFGRQEDAISQNTVLIYPSWVEKLLCNCPDVSDAVAVGVPNAHGESEICACVLPRLNSGLTEDGVLEFYNNALVSRSFDKEFYPAIHRVLLVESFPTRGTGKVDKRGVRETILNMMEKQKE